MGEVGKRTAAEETVYKPCVSHPPQMFRFDVQIGHETHGYGHVRDRSLTVLSKRTKVCTHVFPFDHVQGCQNRIETVLTSTLARTKGAKRNRLLPRVPSN